MKRRRRSSNTMPAKRMRHENDSKVGSVLAKCDGNKISPSSDELEDELELQKMDHEDENRLNLVCQRTKQALHTTLPDRLACRDNETNAVMAFLKSHISSRQPGSMYISGAPGSGKTAVVTKAVEALQNNRDCRAVYVNCMTIGNSLSIFNYIYANLLRKPESSLSAREACSRIEEYVSSLSTSVVLVLDELDSLSSKNQTVLYTVFEWPSLPRSSLVLIGIANSLDLTQRILPRLQMRPDCQPKQLIFASYVRNEITQVLTERLSKVQGNAVFEPKAIEFCAVKVASMAGDMRMALDICRRAVEVFEAEVRRQQHTSTKENSGKNLDLTVRKIGIPQVQRIVSRVYGPKINVLTADDQMTFPLQQELIVCTLLLMLQKKPDKEIMFGKFHEQYCKICPKHGIKVIEQSEFYSLCCLIESRGIISMKKAKDTRSIKVALKMDEDELETVLKNKTLMSSVLQNDR